MPSLERDMTEREKQMEHFAHEHQLIFNDSEEIPFCCNACGLRVLSSPCYMCIIQGCSFYLHEPCTRLPDRLELRVLRHTHDLHLLAKPHHENCKCSKCGELCKNFTYHCDECDGFDLHTLCGHPLDIQIKHMSHEQHPMVAVCKESLLLCDVCGRQHKGFFFACHQCDYWIHQDCTSLPSFLTVGRHRHPLSLTYSAALAEGWFSSDCIICEKDASPLFGAYTCFFCDDLAHVDCAVSAMQDPGKIYNLPPPDDAFLSWTTCVVQNTEPKSDGEITMLEKFHSGHSLIPKNETKHESVCNACIRHIAPPYYSCTQSACDFLLHKFCSDLPLVVHDVMLDGSRELVFPRCNEFFSLYFCRLCLRWGNGLGYHHPRTDHNIFHVECGSAPVVIKHDSHKQHPLVRSRGDWLESIRSCCAKINPYYYDIYSCIQCRFSIHIRCAFLPKTVTHKFDEHPLTLITHSSAHDWGLDHFCEFCEEDIDGRYWFYRCMECDHSFHVECIPSTGTYSRIKFGGSVVLPACHGDHPMTLVRMVSECSHTCGSCHQIIEGFRDGMALHCAGCDFWIHFRCGWKASGALLSKPYINILIYEHHRFI